MSRKPTYTRFLRFFFTGVFCGKTIYALQQKYLKGQNENSSAMNTLVQLLALYTDPESHNAQRHRRTDGQTDRRMTCTIG